MNPRGSDKICWQEFTVKFALGPWGSLSFQTLHQGTAGESRGRVPRARADSDCQGVPQPPGGTYPITTLKKN